MKHRQKNYLPRTIELILAKDHPAQQNPTLSKIHNINDCTDSLLKGGGIGKKRTTDQEDQDQKGLTSRIFISEGTAVF